MSRAEVQSPEVRAAVEIREATPSDVAAALRLEYDVFFENGFCEASEAGVVDDYEKYLLSSVFTIAVAEDEIVGVLREIRQGPHGLPVFNEFEPLPGTVVDAPGQRVAEVGILAVRPDYHGVDLAKELYRAAFWRAKRDGITHWGAVIEAWLWDVFNERFHFTFEHCGVPRDYMGGMCHPLLMSFADTERNIGARDPAAFHWFVDGYPPGAALIAVDRDSVPRPQAC